MKYALCLLLLVFTACGDGVRERRRPALYTQEGNGGSSSLDCENMPDVCQVGDVCSCFYGNEGEPVRRGTTHCDVNGKWTECRDWD